MSFSGRTGVVGGFVSQQSQGVSFFEIHVIARKEELITDVGRLVWS